MNRHLTSPVPALLDRDQQREIARFVEHGYSINELLEMYYWLTREELCSFLATLPDDEPDYEPCPGYQEW